MEPLLQIDDLQVAVPARRRLARRALLHGIDLQVAPGERVALLGASGSGKSLTASALLGTLAPSLEVQGSLLLDGRPIGWRERPQRRRGLAAVFQDARAALNPLVTIGSQLDDAARRSGTGRRAAHARSLELLAGLGFADPERISASHSGGLSGGQRQRACIALALATRPRLLVADEPTTALDSLSQREVVTALGAHTGQADAPALLFITHDVAVAAQLCTRAVVMAEGRIVEQAAMAHLLHHPHHAWTRRLVQAAREETRALAGERITALEGVA
ncbi:ATP-binding cassette domain-containing protein [Luteococcus peritonei]|uniref:ATP-binding cassette domain-containing protein n=1 Tax=Luteococcus peritonei TaxID=88874 RepID=A0ABW4RS96_9ACTN